jgi:hypothetical protein
MYIGGGLLGTILIVAAIVFLLRRYSHPVRRKKFHHLSRLS